IPPSVLLIAYGVVAGVSVVTLYAGAFFPGLMLALLYVLCVMIVAKVSPKSAPPLSEEERRVTLPEFAESIKDSISNRVIPGLLGAMKGKRNINVPMRTLMYNLVVALLPALVFAAAMALTYKIVTAPDPVQQSGLIEMGSLSLESETQFSGGLAEPEGSSLAEPLGAQPLG